MSTDAASVTHVISALVAITSTCKARCLVVHLTGSCRTGVRVVTVCIILITARVGVIVWMSTDAASVTHVISALVAITSTCKARCLVVHLTGSCRTGVRVVTVCIILITARVGVIVWMSTDAASVTHVISALVAITSTCKARCLVVVLTDSRRAAVWVVTVRIILITARVGVIVWMSASTRRTI